MQFNQAGKLIPAYFFVAIGLNFNLQLRGSKYLYIKTTASQIVTTYEKNVTTKIRCTKVYVGMLYFTVVEIKILR